MNEMGFWEAFWRYWILGCCTMLAALLFGGALFYVLSFQPPANPVFMGDYLLWVIKLACIALLLYTPGALMGAIYRSLFRRNQK